MATDGITRHELSLELTAVRNELHGEINALRYELKADIARMETHLVKWMVSLMVGAVAISSTIAVVAQRLLG